MPNAALVVVSLGGPRYHVTGGRAPHVVDVTATPTCDCPDFAFRGAQRPCKHIRAVVEFRHADPQAALVDVLDEKQTLDLVDQSVDGWRTPFVVTPIDPEDKAVAMAAVQQWRTFHGKKPQPNGYYALWRAACAAYAGLDAERDQLPSAAEHYAIARAWVAQLGQKGKAA